MYVENKTIIITDPCYIIKKFGENPYQFPWELGLEEKLGKVAYKELCKNYLNWQHDHNDWRKCDYGGNMKALGITNYISRDTIYGDWSCTTYNTDTNEVLGHFCADAGMVAVFELDEVLKYNPDFNYHIEKPWTTTMLKDFTGNIIIEEFSIDDEKDSEIRVIGKVNINFYTTQTGL